MCRWLWLCVAAPLHSAHTQHLLQGPQGLHLQLFRLLLLLLLLLLTDELQVPVLIVELLLLLLLLLLLAAELEVLMLIVKLLLLLLLLLRYGESTDHATPKNSAAGRKAVLQFLQLLVLLQVLVQVRRMPLCCRMGCTTSHLRLQVQVHTSAGGQGAEAGKHTSRGVFGQSVE